MAPAAASAATMPSTQPDGSQREVTGIAGTLGSTDDSGEGNSQWYIRGYQLEGGSDTQQVSDICARVYDGTDYLPRRIEDYASDPHVVLLVAATTAPIPSTSDEAHTAIPEGAKDLMGGIIGCDLRGDVAFVFGLRVRESARGQGIAKMLYDELCKRISSKQRQAQPSANPGAPVRALPHLPRAMMTATVERNPTAMRIISRHMAGPLHRVDAWPSGQVLDAFEKQIRWPQVQATKKQNMLQAIPGLKEVLEADQQAAALLPSWRQASSEDELWQAVAGIRRAAAAASMPSPSAGPDAAGDQHTGPMEMWLPYVYEVHPVRSEWMRQQLAAGNVWLLPAPSSGAGLSGAAAPPAFAGALVLAFSKECRRQTLGVLLAASSTSDLSGASTEASAASSSGAVVGGVEEAIIHSALLLAGSLQPHFLAYIHRAGSEVRDQGGQQRQRLPEAYRVAGHGDFITYGSVVGGA